MELIAETVFFIFVASIFMSAMIIYELYHVAPPTLDIVHRLVTPVVKPGGDLIIKNDFDREIDCASWWHRYIFDSNQAQVQGFSEYRPVDAAHTYMRSIRIPPTVSPGTYTYEATVFWHCNWVQAITPKEVHLPTITFKVEK